MELPLVRFRLYVSADSQYQAETIAKDTVVSASTIVAPNWDTAEIYPMNATTFQYPVIGEVRGRGAMQAIELVLPGTKTPNTAAMNAVVKYCQSQGVLVLTAGTYSNVVRFLPPLVITDELLKDALSVLDDAFASL